MGETCAHEGELVQMKGKIVGFCLKPVRGTLRKKLENHEENFSARMKGKNCGRLVKPVGGALRKKPENEGFRV